ncbi:citryl-CoA lyase [Ideonella sp. YS5]|uniref:citryl-CoA lyase n=1 Tax=Ideonella sp. YS5 TaxID=3453714 RepID=UPI003EED8BC5
MNAIHTSLWHEEAESGDAFAARRAHCRGYDVYGELVGRASWAEMMLLLWRGERPSPGDARLLEALAVALANPGPRDPSVHAAMCGGVGGSPAAASLMAALGVGAGRLGGGQEVALAMRAWQACGLDVAARRHAMEEPEPDHASIWPKAEHAPGFDPHGRQCAGTVRQALAALAVLSTGPHLPWLLAEREALEDAVGLPLAMTGVAAAALTDLHLSPEQGEMLWLLLRLPGAAAHALEQHLAFKRFPFFEHEIEEPTAMDTEPDHVPA